VEQHSATLEAKHHLLLALTMAVKNVIVCVTQMDHPRVYYAQSAYDTAKEILAKDLARVGYKGQYHFIPISSITGSVPALCTGQRHGAPYLST
jgi:elongation factor 1-alpha